MLFRSMDKELKSLCVKWRLYKNNTLLSEGNFSPSFDVKENNRLVLTEVQQDLTTNTDKYVYLMWISEICTGDITTCDSTVNQNKYSNKKFNASIKIEASTKTKKELVRTKTVIGDVNEDGKENAIDALWIQQYLANTRSLIKQQLFNADVNGDGIVNTTDQLLIKRFSVSMYQNTLPNEPITDYVFYGDVNEDGEIDPRDKMLLGRFLSDDFDTELTFQGLKNADINADGKVNQIDYRLFGRALAGREGYTDILPDNPIKDYILYGDLNNDGEITEEDATLLYNYLDTGIRKSDQALKNSDVNEDGKVNIIDLGLLQMYIESPDNYTNTLPDSPITNYTIQYGDVTLDGNVSISDTNKIFAYMNKKYTLIGQQLLNADVNGDGKIDYVDVDLSLDLSFRDKISSPMTEYTLYGDLNNDGLLDNNDIDKLTKYLNGSTGLDNQARKNADVNGDGLINNTDLTLLQNKINNSTTSPVVASTTPITS